MGSREQVPCTPGIGAPRTDRSQLEQTARRILYTAFGWAMVVVALTVVSIRTYWVVWPVHELASLALGIAGLVICGVAAASAARVLWAPRPVPESAKADLEAEVARLPATLANRSVAA